MVWRQNWQMRTRKNVGLVQTTLKEALTQENDSTPREQSCMLIDGISFRRVLSCTDFLCGLSPHGSTQIRPINRGGLATLGLLVRSGKGCFELLADGKTELGAG